MIPYEDNRVCGLCMFIPTTNPYEDNCMCVCGLCTSVPTTNPYEDNRVCGLCTFVPTKNPYKDNSMCVCVGYARLSPQRILMKTIVCVWAMHVCPHNESL